MTGPIITEEQGGRLMEALATWGRIHYENKGEYPAWTHANITKSCLLGRLIYQGKEPLPYPPPRFMSAPWYGLIENGRDHLWRSFGVWTDGVRVVIGQDPVWTLVEQGDDGSMLVEYPNWGQWLLRAVRPDEPQVEGGRTSLDERGNRTDAWRPTYFDTVLERADNTDGGQADEP